MSIEINAELILGFLAEQVRDEIGRAYVAGEKIAEGTGLSPDDINDAITILIDSGLADWIQVMGTAPYIFGEVGIMPRGRYEYEGMKDAKAVAQPNKGAILHSVHAFHPPSPVGSPYGFQDEDWEYVAQQKSQSSELNVVFGYQFKSEYYDTDTLKQNVNSMMEKALIEYNTSAGSPEANLAFKPLAAGYGEHLFNQIARDIIGSDIAIFDTSDLNANVMIEMGVALTWGTRVLPIRASGCSQSPADISGQTWAEYESSGGKFVDSDHHNKLVQMVRRARQKKPVGS